MWSMCRTVHAANYDVFYFPTTFTYFPQPPWRKVVVTMHDTMGLERPDLVFATRRASWLWRTKEQTARWNAALITTVSESAQHDLARYFHLSPHRIAVLTLGACRKHALARVRTFGRRASGGLAWLTDVRESTATICLRASTRR
jgi:hypothetical protein